MSVYGLYLQGWDDRSVWGFDDPGENWFAQLWRNGQPDNPDGSPHHWIPWVKESDTKASLEKLAREIAAKDRG